MVSSAGEVLLVFTKLEPLSVYDVGFNVHKFAMHSLKVSLIYIYMCVCVCLFEYAFIFIIIKKFILYSCMFDIQALAALEKRCVVHMDIKVSFCLFDLKGVQLLYPLYLF